MQRAIRLSEKGLGQTHTNPLVGCVIAYNDRVIGEGYHTGYGAAHAEVEAIRSVSENDKQFLDKSTLYVTLEPCCHYGKTPPCTDLILEKNIPNVVIAHLDPFEKVAGKGVEKLKNAGVNVRVGFLKEEAAFVNRRFLWNQEKHKPYVILKWAETADGFIAGNEPGQKQISGSLAQLLLHRWRSEESAFLIGKNTLLHDSPLLTNRLWSGNNPVRVVLGNADVAYLQLPFFKVNEPTYLIGMSHGVQQIHNAELVSFDPHNIEAVLEFVMQEQLSSLVVEGGKKVLESFINAGFWNEIRVFKSKYKLFKNGVKAPEMPQQEYIEQDLKDDNLIVLYKNAF